MYLGGGVTRPHFFILEAHQMKDQPSFDGNGEELYLSTLTNTITSNTTTSISNKHLLNPKHFIYTFLFNLSPQVYELSIIIPI